MMATEQHQKLVEEMNSLEGWLMSMDLPSLIKDLASLYQIPEHNLIDSLLLVAQNSGKNFWTVVLAAYSMKEKNPCMDLYKI